MKKILCFGDSNTYGYIPHSAKRYDKKTRWSGILQMLLKDRFEIIEAGCNNRTGFCDNPAGYEQTGYKILPSYLEDDLSCIILAVGINDLQKFYNPTYEEISLGLESLIKIIRTKCKKQEIIIVSPSKLTDDIMNGGFAFQYDGISIEKSLKIGEIYEKVSKEQNCRFADLSKLVEFSKKDGLHYEPEDHKKIAYTLYEIICQIYHMEKNV